MRTLSKPSSAKCNLNLYTLFLLAEPKSVSCQRLAQILEHLSHDSINRFLVRERYTPRDLFEWVKPRIQLHGGILSGGDTAIDALDPLLRLYEGCASRTNMLRMASNGRLEEANVIKFHCRKPKISYLVYPAFDADPHPALYTSMQVDLQNLHVSYRDYDPEDNPPVLHQKCAGDGGLSPL